jgi:hypothetical protein
LKWGTIGERDKRMGKEGEGQFTSNLGPEWTGVAPQKMRDSKQVRGTREQGRDSLGRGELSRVIVKGLSRGLCHVLQYNVNPVHIVLLCVCCANKRIVFRL